MGASNAPLHSGNIVFITSISSIRIKDFFFFLINAEKLM